MCTSPVTVLSECLETRRGDHFTLRKHTLLVTRFSTYWLFQPSPEGADVVAAFPSQNSDELSVPSPDPW